MAEGFPRLRAIADSALLVEFGECIAPEIHARVLALDAALAAAPFPGLAETVPAYAALLIRFDPLLTDHAGAESAVRRSLSADSANRPEPALHEIGVCYDADLGPDLAEVARLTGLTPEAVIAAHLGGDYSVYMYGFAPGYAYLAGVPPVLHLPRKPAARRGVAAGSVLIAGPQCLVSTLTMPTGWWILGRSADRILMDDPDRPFRFGVGDRVRFHRIDRATCEAGVRA